MATWHVSPLGNDANDGKSWHTCFGTIGKAIAASTAGDTILMAPGNYEMQSPILLGNVTMHGYSWTMVDEQSDPYTFSPFRHAYTLQPNSWLTWNIVFEKIALSFPAVIFCHYLLHISREGCAIGAGTYVGSQIIMRSILELRRRWKGESQ